MSASSTAHADRRPLRGEAILIGLIGLAHLISHYSQLLLAPLFPWLKEAFGVNYIELGFLMTLFFAVSCSVQAGSGLLVDRYGPRPVLYAGLALLALLAAAAFGLAASTSYAALAVFASLAGVGNGVFHPVDYTFLNRKVSTPRLGHAYSVHGITGSLGWALAPAMLVPLAIAFSWRVALAGAGLLILGVLGLLWFNRRTLELSPSAAGASEGTPHRRSFDFLRIPAVWVCFGFFFFYAVALSVVQAFAPEAARQLHQVPVALAAACLTVYMVCSAGGMVLGGFLAADPSRSERIVAVGLGVAAAVAAFIGFGSLSAAAVPVLFAAMGFAVGVAGPSRDLLVKRSTPENATGRVYGIVYAGLDIGQAAAPVFFGYLMDQGLYRGVWFGLVLTQLLLIGTAFNVQRGRRTVPARA